MRRLVIFAAIWIFLFVGTIVVNVLSGEGRATADVAEASNTGASDATDPFDDVLRRLARIELVAQPRQSEVGTPGTTAGFDERNYQKLASEFRSVLMDNKERLLGCVSQTLARLRRPTEYFEMSFVFRSAGSGTVFRIDELVIERATSPFPADEQKCIFEVFQELRFVADSSPVGRIFYEFCLNRPSQTSGFGHQTESK